MIDIKLVQINNFILKYDGIFTIETQEFTTPVFLPLDAIIKILQNEGVIDSIGEYDLYNQGILITKSTLIIEAVLDGGDIVTFTFSFFFYNYEKYRLKKHLGAYTIDETIHKCILKE